MGEMRNTYNILVSKTEGKRALGRPRHRWEASIELDRKEIIWEGMDWIHLAHNRFHCQAVVNAIINQWVP
jgi:hypothetical protein